MGRDADSRYKTYFINCHPLRDSLKRLLAHAEVKPAREVWIGRERHAKNCRNKYQGKKTHRSSRKYGLLLKSLIKVKVETVNNSSPAKLV